MSDFDFLVWSFALSGALGLLGVGLTIAGRRYAWADHSWAARDRRLRRRLEGRLARGSDRYFEERRTIDAEIEQHQHGRPTGPERLGSFRILLAIGFAIWAGPALMSFAVEPLFGVTPPVWTRSIGIFALPLIGVQNILFSYQSKSSNTWPQRLLGLAVLAIGIWMVSLAVYHNLAPEPAGMGA